MSITQRVYALAIAEMSVTELVMAKDPAYYMSKLGLGLEDDVNDSES